MIPSLIRGYDRSWAVGTVACTALFATGISLWSVMVSDRLPAELATHWNEQNIAGGFEPLFGINLLLSLTAIVLWALVCGLAIARRGASALLARVGVGLGVFFSLGVNAIHLTLIASQRDAPDPARVTMNPALMIPTVGLAALAGLLAFIFYRPQPAA